MRELDDTISVGGQVWPDDVPALAAQGVAMLINNRPDHEEPGQPTAAEMAAAAEAVGIAYRHIPVAGLTQQGIEDMTEALDAATGPVVAFCRSGTRSTYLWALARSGREDAETLSAKAAAAGYDLTPVKRFLR